MLPASNCRCASSLATSAAWVRPRWRPSACSAACAVTKATRTSRASISAAWPTVTTACARRVLAMFRFAGIKNTLRRLCDSARPPPSPLPFVELTRSPEITGFCSRPACTRSAWATPRSSSVARSSRLLSIATCSARSRVSGWAISSATRARTRARLSASCSSGTASGTPTRCSTSSPTSRRASVGFTDAHRAARREARDHPAYFIAAPPAWACRRPCGPPHLILGRVAAWSGLAGGVGRGWIICWVMAGMNRVPVGAGAGLDPWSMPPWFMPPWFMPPWPLVGRSFAGERRGLVGVRRG
jgi:hypothetical protein